ncbi:T9SS type A sorting domain-containing protein [Polaribacter sp. P097]|uniref:T9SS type A sorting domain-containing protein n=1 Tax=Polaribacter sp. P097 TaxID=3117398 RepID=UPI002FE2322E
MKKTLLLFCLILISALSYGQTNLVLNGTCDIHTNPDNKDNADSWDMTPNSKIIDESGAEIDSPYRALWYNTDLADWLETATGDGNEQPGSSSDGNWDYSAGADQGVKTGGVKISSVGRRLYQLVAVEAGKEYTFSIESRSEAENVPSEVFMLNTEITSEDGLSSTASTVDGYMNITNDFNSSKSNATTNNFTVTTFDFTASTNQVVIYVRASGAVDSSTEVFYDNISLVEKAASSAGTVVTPSTTTFDAGYMNAFNLDDTFAFGFGYPVANMKTTQTATSVTLQPNFAIWDGEDGNAAWFDADPKTPNKYVEASSYTESNAFNGEDLTFEGVVNVANLDNAYTVTAFIKALDPSNSYATVVLKSVELTAAGQEFSVSATAAELAAGLVVQYGFSVVGPPADPANESSLGSVVVGEPGTASVDDVFASNLTVYPNPANSFVNISSSENISGVEVYNVIGKRVLQVTNVVNNSIDVSSLSKGMYILKIASGDSIATKKIIKN